MSDGSSAGSGVVILVGNPRGGSRTSALAQTVVDQLADSLGGVLTGFGDVEVLELADLVGITFTGHPAVAPHPHPDPWAVVRSARLLVVATPTYKGTYTGVLKLFLDGFDGGELEGVVAVPAAIAGKPAHRDSVGATLSDLLLELGAAVPAQPIVLLEPEVTSAETVVRSWALANVAALRSALEATLPVAGASR